MGQKDNLDEDARAFVITWIEKKKRELEGE